jgi:hypothetical protein
MKAPVVIGGVRYPTKAAAHEECRRILYGGPPGSQIIGADEEFAMSLLRARRDKIAEIGTRAIVRLIRLKHRHNTPCFAAELEDGTRLDFSFYKAIEELADRQK